MDLSSLDTFLKLNDIEQDGVADEMTCSIEVCLVVNEREGESISRKLSIFEL